MKNFILMPDNGVAICIDDVESIVSFEPNKTKVNFKSGNYVIIAASLDLVLKKILAHTNSDKILNG